jgi:hypothetical protein
MKRLGRVALVLSWALLSGGIARGQARLGLHVVDANGQKVGYVLDSSHAVIFIEGYAYSVDTGRFGFLPRAFPMFYATVDCSGTAYVPSTTNLLFDSGWYTSDGLLHYPSVAAPQPVVFQSFKSLGDDGVPGPCAGTTGGDFAVPVASSPAPSFTSPFQVVDALLVSPAPAVATFNDVPTTHPFFQFIEALAASGITAGCQTAPPLYCPDSPLTRGQMAVFLAKALGL